MNTRLLIRPVSDIRILDTQFIDGGLLGLLVDDLYQLDIRVGDTLGLVFDEKTLNPQYNGTCQVLAVGSGTFSCCSTDPENTIVVNLNFGQSTFQEGGYIKNIIRDGISIRFQTIDLDLKEELQFPLTYNLVDIRSPQNRKSDFSKTITLPGTKHNNQIMESIFEISADSHFNPNIRKDIIILNDGLEVFSGFMKLEKISRNNWEEVSYEIKISGRLLDFFTKLVNGLGEDLLLDDLNLDDYNHVRTRDSILNSWEGNIKKNGVDYQNYILGPTFSVIDTNFVDTGRTKFVLTTAPTGLKVGDVVRFEMDNPGDPSVNFNQSQGHHTIIDIGTNSVTVNLEFRVGAANSGTLAKWESKGEGYVYPTINFGKASNEITNWKVLDFIPHFYVKNIVDRIFTYINFEYESDFFNSDFFKRLIIPYGNYESSPFFGARQSAPVNITGFYSEPPALPCDDDSIPPYNDPLSLYDITTKRFVIVAEGVYTFRVFSDVTFLTSDRIVIYVRDSLNGNIKPNTFGFPSITSQNQGINVTFDTTFQIIFDPSDVGREFYIAIEPLNNGPFMASWTINNSYFRVNDASEKPDSKIKAKDILTSLISMFNLYFEADSFNPRKIIIEPYINYYRLNDSKDWTKKLDISKQVEIEPTSSDISKSFRWSYKEDADFLNKKYKDNFNEIYGETSVVSETQFNTNLIEFKTEFSQSVLCDTNTNGELIIPVVVKDIQQIQNNLTLTSIEKYNTRIYYWTGIRYTNSFKINGISTSDYFNLPVFGYAGHFDNPKDATLDLNYGFSNEYYYGGEYPTYITENTLYNKYYRDYIEEITDKNSKLLRGYFKLTSSDISTLSFRRFYYIDNVLYRLQSIKDFDPLKNDTTLCEFLKVNRSLISIPKRRINIIVKGESIKNPIRTGGTIKPNTLVYGSDNTLGTYTGGVIVVGNGNQVESDVDTTIVTGDNNTIKSGTTDVNVFGNNNEIGSTLSNIKNVFVVGDGITANESNTNYIGGETSQTLLSGGMIEFERNLLVDDLDFLQGTLHLDGQIWTFEKDGCNGGYYMGGDFTKFNGDDPFSPTTGVTASKILKVDINGHPDLIFSSNTGTGFNLTVSDISRQSDGKILVGGGFTQFNGNTRNRLVRLNSDGTEDTTFYTNLGTGFNGGFNVRSIQVQSDGKILVGGSFTTFKGNTRNRLVRLNSDGTEDTTFYTKLGTGFNGSVAKIKIQPDGKILVGGDFTSFKGNTRNRLVRLNSDGTEDTTFYINLSGGFNFTVRDFTIDSQDNIYVIGIFNIASGVSAARVAKYSSNGTFSSTFNTNIGTVFYQNFNPRGIDVFSDDSILIVGQSFDSNRLSNIGIVKLSSDGEIDMNFYNAVLGNGLGTSWVSTNQSYCVLIDNDRRILTGRFVISSGDDAIVNGYLGAALYNIKKTIIDSNEIIIGDGSENLVIELNDVIKLNPITATPSCPKEGTIFYSQGNGLKFYDGSNWRSISFT